MECCLRKLYVVQKDLKVVLNRIDGHSKIEHIAYEIGGWLEIKCPSENECWFEIGRRLSADLKMSANLKFSCFGISADYQS